MRLSRLPDALAARFGAVESAAPDPRRKNAAVALVLRPPRGAADPAARQCDFLAIRRARSRRDPWSGHMALPGGRLDPSDPGLLEAAARETLEETGVDLGAVGAVLGRGEPVRPLAAAVPAISIWPFAFAVDADTAASAASPEVASAHWFPLAAIEDEARRGTHLWRGGGMQRAFPCVRIEGRTIWGLTYRILTRFLEVG